MSIATTERTKEYYRGDDNMHFETNYVDPEKLCVTRSSKLEKGKGIVRKDDLLFFDLKRIQAATTFQIHLHYPGQFIKYSDIPVVETVFNGNDKSQKVTLMIPDITTLRRRSRPAQPCDDTDVDDIPNHRIHAMEKVQCKPSYWNFFDEDRFFEVCNTTLQLQQIYREIKDRYTYLSSGTEPCSAMLIPSAVQKDSIPGFGQIQISIHYSVSQYQEIINVQDFNFDSMFSGIGGFVGIFLGYSFLQVTDLISTSTFLTVWKYFGEATKLFCCFCAAQVNRGNVIITKICEEM